MDRKLSKIIATLFLLCCVIGSILKIGFCEGIQGETVENTMSELPTFITYEVDSTRFIEQNFTPQYGIISNIKLIMLQVGEGATGTLHVEVLGEDKRVYGSYEREIADLSVGQWVSFEGTIQVPAKENCILRVYTSEESQPVLFMICNSAFDIDENQACIYQGQEIPGGLLVTFDYMQTYSSTGKLMVCIAIAIFGIMAILWVDARKNFYEIIQKLYKDHDLTLIGCGVGVIIVTALFYYTHIYRLFEVPYGIHIDAMGMGYDAWSIANFGVDRYLKSYPVYLVNFGGGQSALYMYIVAFMIKLFHYSDKLIRIPALINACVILTAGSAIVYKKWHKKSVVLGYALMFTISPVFTMFTRLGLDCNLMLGVSTIFLLALIYAVEKQKKRYFVIAGVIAGILLYTYALSYLMLPLFLLGAMIYLCHIGKLDFKKIFVFAIPLAVFAMPLILVQIVNRFDIPEMKIGPFTITKLLQYRQGEITFSHYFSNLYSTIKCVFWNDMWNYDSLPEYRNMYWFTVPFAMLGLVKACYNLKNSMKAKNWDLTNLIFIWFMSILLVGGLLDGGSGPTCYKVNAIYFAMLFLAMDGAICIYQLINKADWKKGYMAVIAVAYFCTFISFTEFYYNIYVGNVYPSVFFDQPYREAMAYYQTLPEEVQQREVIIQNDKKITGSIYFGATLFISPYDFDYEHFDGTYQNFTLLNSLDIEIDAQKVYFINETDRSFAIQLEQNGFIVNKVGARYVAYCL